MNTFPKSSILTITAFVFVLLISITQPVKAQCYADTDVNGDGLTLSINDMSFLIDFLYLCGPTPPDLYKADLNGDCIIDTNDIHVFEEYYIYGLAAFDPYGGYPVETCCDPIIKRANIVATLFGMQHNSRGSACLEDIDDTLHITDLDLVPGSNENGFDAQPMIVPGFKGWNCRFMEDPSIPVDASILTDFIGNVDGAPDELVGSMRQEKRPDGKWDIWIQALPGVYQIDGYHNGTALRQDRGSWTTNNTAWVNIGSLGSKVKDANNGPYDMSIANMDDAGKLDLCFGTEDSALWTWEDEGIYDQLVTTVSFRSIDTDHVWISDITSLSQYGDNLSSYGIVNENYTFKYNEFNITNIGDAVIDPVIPTLVVSTADSTQPYGLVANGEYETDILEPIYHITYAENPTVPIGGTVVCAAVDEHLPGESFFDIFATTSPPPPGPDFPAESFFDVYYSMAQTKVSPTEWDVKVYSIVPATYVVEASLDGTVLYTSLPIPATGSYVDIGTVGSIAKGPDTGPHYQSISNIDDAGIIAIEQPDTLIYNWPGQGIVDMMIDEVKVTISHNPLGINLLPTIVANGLPELIIEDISVSSGCCVVRGDVLIPNDGLVLVNDVILLVNYIFKSGPPPECAEAGDVVVPLDGLILVNDLVYLVNYIFKSGPPPPPC